VRIQLRIHSQIGRYEGGGILWLKRGAVENVVEGEEWRHGHRDGFVVRAWLDVEGAVAQLYSHKEGRFEM